MSLTAAPATTTNRRMAVLTTISTHAVISLIVSVQGLVLIPLYINLIGPRVYGAWIATGDVLFWLGTLELGIPNLLIQRIGAAIGKGDEGEVGRWFASGMCVLAGLACCLLLVAVGFHGFLTRWPSLPQADQATLKGSFLIACFAAGLSLFNNGFVALARGLQDVLWSNLGVIASVILGFIVTVAMLLNGGGLWSIAAGMIVRSVVQLGSGLGFVLWKIPQGIKADLKPRNQVLRELLKLSPLTALGTLGYSLLAQSDAVIAAYFIGPEIATQLSITRRLLDFMRSFVDMFCHASLGAFAQLVATKDRDRAMLIVRELSSLRTFAAMVFYTTYVAVNGSFVRIWIGPHMYGGILLTVLLAVSAMISGYAYLLNTLYRAAGRIAEGSLLLVAESIVRMPLAILGGAGMSLHAIPAAGLLTSTVACAILQGRLRRELAAADMPSPAKRTWSIVLYGLLAIGSVLVGFFSGTISGWTLSLLWLVFAGAVATFLTKKQPELGEVLVLCRKLTRSLRPSV